MQQICAGTPGSVGSTETWKGHRKAGAGVGTLFVSRIAAAEIDIDLHFMAPLNSWRTVEYRLFETVTSAKLTCTMTSPR